MYHINTIYRQDDADFQVDEEIDDPSADDSSEDGEDNQTQQQKTTTSVPARTGTPTNNTSLHQQRQVHQSLLANIDPAILDMANDIQFEEEIISDSEISQQYSDEHDFLKVDLAEVLDKNLAEFDSFQPQPPLEAGKGQAPSKQQTDNNNSKRKRKNKDTSTAAAAKQQQQQQKKRGPPYTSTRANAFNATNTVAAAAAAADPSTAMMDISMPQIPPPPLPAPAAAAAPIARRTRAQNPLLDVTMDELDTLLADIDEPLLYLPIDDQAEYKRFLASVQPGAFGPRDNIGHNDGNNNRVGTRATGVRGGGGQKEQQNSGLGSLMFGASEFYNEDEDDEDDEDFMMELQRMFADAGGDYFLPRLGVGSVSSKREHHRKGDGGGGERRPKRPRWSRRIAAAAQAAAVKVNNNNNKNATTTTSTTNTTIGKGKDDDEDPELYDKKLAVGAMMRRLRPGAGPGRSNPYAIDSSLAGGNDKTLVGVGAGMMPLPLPPLPLQQQQQFPPGFGGGQFMQQQQQQQQQVPSTSGLTHHTGGVITTNNNGGGLFDLVPAATATALGSPDEVDNYIMLPSEDVESLPHKVKWTAPLPAALRKEGVGGRGVLDVAVEGGGGEVKKKKTGGSSRDDDVDLEEPEVVSACFQCEQYELLYRQLHSHSQLLMQTYAMTATQANMSSPGSTEAAMYARLAHSTADMLNNLAEYANKEGNNRKSSGYRPYISKFLGITEPEEVVLTTTTSRVENALEECPVSAVFPDVIVDANNNIIGFGGIREEDNNDNSQNDHYDDEDAGGRPSDRAALKEKTNTTSRKVKFTPIFTDNNEDDNEDNNGTSGMQLPDTILNTTTITNTNATEQEQKTAEKKKFQLRKIDDVYTIADVTPLRPWHILFNIIEIDPGSLHPTGAVLKWKQLERQKDKAKKSLGIVGGGKSGGVEEDGEEEEEEEEEEEVAKARRGKRKQFKSLRTQMHVFWAALPMIIRQIFLEMKNYLNPDLIPTAPLTATRGKSCIHALFSDADDILLAWGIRKYGFGKPESQSVQKIQRYLLPAFTSAQIYHRRKNLLSKKAADNAVRRLNSVMHGPLTAAEVAVLSHADLYYGKQPFKWDTICKRHLPHRSPHTLGKLWSQHTQGASLIKAPIDKQTGKRINVEKFKKVVEERKRVVAGQGQVQQLRKELLLANEQVLTAIGSGRSKNNNGNGNTIGVGVLGDAKQQKELLSQMYKTHNLLRMQYKNEVKDQIDKETAALLKALETKGRNDDNEEEGDRDEAKPPKCTTPEEVHQLMATKRQDLELQAEGRATAWLQEQLAAHGLLGWYYQKFYQFNPLYGMLFPMVPGLPPLPVLPPPALASAIGYMSNINNGSGMVPSTLIPPPLAGTDGDDVASQHFEMELRPLVGSDSDSEEGEEEEDDNEEEGALGKNKGPAIPSPPTTGGKNKKKQATIIATIGDGGSKDTRNKSRGMELSFMHSDHDDDDDDDDHGDGGGDYCDWMQEDPLPPPPPPLDHHHQQQQQQQYSERRGTRNSTRQAAKELLDNVKSGAIEAAGGVIQKPPFMMKKKGVGAVFSSDTLSFSLGGGKSVGFGGGSKKDGKEREMPPSQRPSSVMAAGGKPVPKAALVKKFMNARQHTLPEFSQDVLLPHSDDEEDEEEDQSIAGGGSSRGEVGKRRKEGKKLKWSQEWNKKMLEYIDAKRGKRWDEEELEGLARELGNGASGRQVEERFNWLMKKRLELVKKKMNG
jgi:hypothetical protein